MRTTIDGAGRIVVPKAIRDRLLLRGGEELDIEEAAGRIEISRVPREVGLVQTRHGLLAADPAGGPPGLSADEVRERLERIRR